MRVFLKRIVLVAVAPVFLLLILEVILRLSGFGVPARLYLVGEWGGRTLATENPHYTRKYFGARLERTPWPAAFAVPKPADEFRVFVLGESAALGDPIPEYGMPRILEVILQESMPEKHVRVINSAITAINSHVIREIAGEISRYEPDAVVVYMGNNEVVGPFGPSTVFPAVAGSYRMIQFTTFVRGTRVGQGLAKIAEWIHPPAFTQWKGMEMFLDRQIMPDDPRLVTVHRMFEENLTAICSMFEAHSIPIWVGTVPVNLRDCAPLASPPDHRADEIYLEARRADAAGRHKEALTLYGDAMEKDVLRFRADSAINSAIRKAGHHAPGSIINLVDLERSVRDASPDGIPGESLFYDHVHLNFTGQYLAASNFAAGITKQRELLSQHEAATFIGWTDWSEKEAWLEMYTRRMHPPFANQIDREEMEKRWADRLIEYDLATRDTGLSEAAQALSLALKLRGDSDQDIWQLLADVHIRQQRADLAALAYGRAADLLPHRAGLRMSRAAALAVCESPYEGFRLIRHDPFWKKWKDDALWSSLGSQLIEWGWVTEAEVLYHQAWLLNHDNPDALVNLGASRAMSGNPEDAVTMLRSAVKQKPGDDVAMANLGRALYESGKKEEGITTLERAVKLNPDNGLTRSSLAVIYFREKKYDLAREQFNAAMIEEPLDVALLMDAARLAVAESQWERAGMLQSRAARLSPQDAYIQYQTAQILLQTNRKKEAVDFLRNALRLAPGQIEWKYNLIWILATHPDPGLRDPPAALALAEELPSTPSNTWMKIDLKAAALAADGQIGKAAALLEQINPQTIPALFQTNVQNRLDLYRHKLAYVASLEEFVPVIFK